MKKAMITIEVLVAMLILFLVITTSFSNIKFYNIMNDKKRAYEDTYMNVLSIKDKISSTICKTMLKEEGNFNDVHFIATCQKLKELRTFRLGMELGDPSGNIGNYLMKLYEVTLVLNGEKYEKVYTYSVTQAEQLYAE